MADAMNDPDGKGVGAPPAGKGVGGDPKDQEPVPTTGSDKGKGVGSEPAGVSDR